MFLDNKMTIGQKIKALRLANGRSQKEFAKMISSSPQAISKWENGKNMPDISMLPKIADIFGTSIDELLGHKTTK
jgi:transcriptional regulator with XRE-family HTH domain